MADAISTTTEPPPDGEPAKVRVLFVCTGNICRSPTAEGVFRRLVTQAGLGATILTDSAGTGGWHVGQPPDSRSQATAKQRGVDLSGQRARRVSSEDFQDFDYLVAMDRGHQQALLRLAPTGQEQQVHLLMSYAGDRTLLDVPDPYYGGVHGFDHVFDLIERGCKGLLAHIRHQHLRKHA